ncbi:MULTISPECIES: PTS sugar transporter subunit IIA [Listeria]|uniref:PTS system, fructose-specific IIA component n=1 Tax=Listeria ivanovii TaxID=1638 RepID=A0AAX2DRI5_LISIV|nr:MULTISPECIES: PTS sugar transporter subunit IIA [Listeria]AIS61602.1 PTS sugar transporter subunit IIA [Listeria ivanovii subsp. londoniensis]MBC1515957.1 PTS sugar transporter subunit IIA [Listeria immobilis]MBC2019382.1 PTS sugar transporter subunit IIA [Listeria seeligeri]MBC2254449.1 PTS sugar transporter subunit IIA [Listeria ivanovii]MBC6296115.1 PTS sugar transporter subunit IIA [Listeria immobilis]
MDISNLINESRIIFDTSIQTKQLLFEKVANVLGEEGAITNQKKFIRDLYKREEETSTGIESGFGIPHTKSKYVKEPLIVFVHSDVMTDYFGLDDAPIECSFIIGVPKKAADTHLEILSNLSRKLMNDEFIEKLKKSKNEQEIMTILSE